MAKPIQTAFPGCDAESRARTANHIRGELLEHMDSQARDPGRQSAMPGPEGTATVPPRSSLGTRPQQVKEEGGVT